MRTCDWCGYRIRLIPWRLTYPWHFLKRKTAHMHFSCWREARGFRKSNQIGSHCQKRLSE